MEAVCCKPSTRYLLLVVTFQVHCAFQYVMSLHLTRWARWLSAVKSSLEGSELAVRYHFDATIVHHAIVASYRFGGFPVLSNFTCC
jgi:hypothetical protein